VVRSPEFLRELQVVGRVGENHIHRIFGELRENFEAVAGEDLVEGNG
jgi:hypothetical protein